MKTSWTRRGNSYCVGAIVTVAACLGADTVAEAQVQESIRRGIRASAAPQQTSANLPIAASTREAIDAVYRLATEADSVGQLDLALRQSGELSGQSLEAEDATYLQQLRGWLLNRRGEAHAIAAGRAMDSGQEAEAIQLERQAVGDFNAALEHEPHWRAYHNRGVSLAMLGKYDESIASFTEAIDLNPGYSSARFNRAELWLEMGRHESAEKDYTEVLQLDASDFSALMGRGHARFYLTRFDEALADFDAAITRQPDDAVAYADRADLNAFLGQWEQAAQDYRIAIKLDRRLGRAYQSAAWLMATCPEDRYRDTQLALKAAERAVELDGVTDYRYLDTLAAAQANARQFPAAVQSVQRAIQTAPPDARSELQQRLTLYQAQRPFRDQQE